MIDLSAKRRVQHLPTRRTGTSWQDRTYSEILQAIVHKPFCINILFITRNTKQNCFREILSLGSQQKLDLKSQNVSAFSPSLRLTHQHHQRERREGEMDMFDFASKYVESIIQMMSTNFITFFLIFSGVILWSQYRRPSRKTHVAIDLSFSKEMCLKELISLRKQIKLCYSLGRRRESKILVASFDEEKVPSMDKLNYRNWKRSAVEFVTDNVETMKGPWSEIVYLSPDAEETLDHVRGDVLYVIGGIVDKVVKRNMSLNRATAMNAKTVRFPVREYLVRRGSEKTTKTELNIDTAYDILLRRRQGETWDKIF